MSQIQYSPTSKPTSPSTALTTPDQSPGHDSDIWASDHDDDDHITSRTHNDNNNSSNTTVHRRHELLSDLPSIRRQHMTDGYREGLSVGKAKVMQSGFDDGYPIGVEIALRAGTVLGVLEGWIAASSVSVSVSTSSTAAAAAASGGSDGSKVKSEGETEEERRQEVERLYDLAKEELACTALLKGIRDEVVAEAKGIPEEVLVVLERWEGKVLGVSSRDNDGVKKSENGDESGDGTVMGNA